MVSRNRKATLFAIFAFFFACNASAQIANPGVQQSGAVTAGHVATFGPGLGQIQDGGGAPIIGTPSALSSANDTNVTLTLTGAPATALLQTVTATMGWSGTLAAGRLNSNVVQSVTNDTNVAGAISGQNLTLSWLSTLSVARGGTGSGTQSGAAINILPSPTRAGDVLYWNGSTWITLAGNNSGTAVFSENSSGVPSWTAAGTGTVTSAAVVAGTGVSVSGTCSSTSAVNCTVNQSLTNVTLQSGSIAPTGTTSTVGVMMGLGATCKMTPAYSSRVTVAFTGTVSNSVTGTGTNSVRYGTGTAPINGAAATGTAIGATQMITTNANYDGTLSMTVVITGLTPGTGYWFDLDVLTNGGTYTIAGVSCSGFEF